MSRKIWTLFARFAKKVKKNSDPFADPFKASKEEHSLALNKQKVREMQNDMRWV